MASEVAKGLQSASGRPSMGQTVSFTLLNPNAIYPIFTILCDFLPIADIVALTRTCKTLSGLYRSLLPVKWNVDRMLLKFFRNPRGFRQLIGKTDALVSGSPVFQSFERTSWSDSSLDVFVQAGEKADAFTQYLAGIECYRLQQAESKPARPSSTIPYEQEYQIYVRGEMMVGTLTEIHVITTPTAPILAFLPTVYSTILVNFFIHDKAFSIYPKQTFIRYRAFHLQRDGPSYASFVDQHQQRGWEFPIIEASPLHNPRYPIQEIRRIGDTDTWSIPFEADNMLRSPPPYVLEYSQFSCRITYAHEILSRLIDPKGFPLGMGSYLIEARSFTAGNLRYQYTSSPRCSWREFLLYGMERRTKAGTPKAIPSNKATDFVGSTFTVDSGPTRLNSSPKCPIETYFDDEIPRIYNEWLHSDVIADPWLQPGLARLD